MSDSTGLIVQTSVSIVGIVATAAVAIYTIRSSAKESKIKSVFDQMVDTIVEQFQALHETLNLLCKVANKVHISKIPDGTIVETGYDRYWREIETIAKRTNAIRSRKELFFPDEVTKCVNKVIVAVNEASELAKTAKADARHEHKDLLKKYEEAVGHFDAALNCVRKYLGTDKLTKLSSKDSESLQLPTESRDAARSSKAGGDN